MSSDTETDHDPNDWTVIKPTSSDQVSFTQQPEPVYDLTKLNDARREYFRALNDSARLKTQVDTVIRQAMDTTKRQREIASKIDLRNNMLSRIARLRARRDTLIAKNQDSLESIQKTRENIATSLRSIRAMIVDHAISQQRQQSQTTQQSILKLSRQRLSVATELESRWRQHLARRFNGLLGIDPSQRLSPWLFNYTDYVASILNAWVKVMREDPSLSVGYRVVVTSPSNTERNNDRCRAFFIVDDVNERFLELSTPQGQHYLLAHLAYLLWQRGLVPSRYDSIWDRLRRLLGLNWLKLRYPYDYTDVPLLMMEPKTTSNDLNDGWRRRSRVVSIMKPISSYDNVNIANDPQNDAD